MGDERSFSACGVGGLVADTASVSSGKSNEALFSPGGSPGVLDNPPVVTGTDQEDTVVELGLAVVEDSGLVGRPVGSIDCD